MNEIAEATIRLSSRVVRNEAIDFTQIDDTVVMMDLDEGRYYEFDRVGARVWALLESTPQVAEMCEVLVAEFQVPAETCRDEVRTFLDELLRLAVVQVQQWDDGNEKADTHGGAPLQENPGHLNPASGAGKAEKQGLPWTTPTIRIMKVERITKGGTQYDHPTLENFYYFPMS